MAPLHRRSGLSPAGCDIAATRPGNGYHEFIRTLAGGGTYVIEV